MKIASIDAGVNTGLVICSYIIRVGHVVLRPELVTTCQTSQALEIVDVLDRRKCKRVVLERMPDYGNPHGKQLYQGLLQYYAAGNYDAFVKARMPLAFLVAPSEWKPFMKHRLGLLPSCETQHEKDALAMLFYFFQVNHPDKRVLYE